jgi:hypothetical protein
MRAPEAWVVLPLLAAWAMIVDIPLFMLDGSDDGFYTEVANLWTKGSPPYVGAFDVKAPGFFALLALAQLMLGPALATLKIVATAFSALAMTSLYTLCRRYDRMAAFACALLYPVLTELCGDPWFHLICEFPGAGFEKLQDVMASRPRYVVVSETAKPLRCEQASHWSLVHNALSQSYLAIGTATGPRDSFTIYQRR